MGKNKGIIVSATAWNKGFIALEPPAKMDIIIPCAPNDDIAVSGMNIDSLVFARSPRSKAFLVTDGLGSSLLPDTKKNGLRGLWSRPLRLVRPQSPARPRQTLRRHADLPGGRDPAGLLPGLWDREAREAGVFGGQSVLHQTLRLLRRPTLSDIDHQGRGRGTESRLEHRQNPRNPVYARAAATFASAAAEGDRPRRGLAAPGTHLPDRRQRLGSASSPLVRGQGPFREKPGRVLRLAGPPGEQADPAGRHGHVEGLLQIDQTQRAPGRYPVRQVPCHPAPRRGSRQGAQERVRSVGQPGSALHQGAEVHLAVQSGEPHEQRSGQPPVVVESQQASPHGLPAQGVVRAIVELSPRGVGAAVLQQLARVAQMAAIALVREVRGDDRAPLEWDRGVLQAREQGRSGFRGGLQQQDSSHPAARLWNPRRGVLAPQDPDLHVAADLRFPC